MSKPRMEIARPGVVLPVSVVRRLVTERVNKEIDQQNRRWVLAGVGMLTTVLAIMCLSIVAISLATKHGMNSTVLIIWGVITLLVSALGVWAIKPYIPTQQPPVQ